MTQEDKEQVITSASDISIPADQEILHRIPQYYTIDGQMGIKEPLGMAIPNGSLIPIWPSIV